MRPGIFSVTNGNCGKNGNRALRKGAGAGCQVVELSPERKGQISGGGHVHVRKVLCGVYGYDRCDCCGGEMKPAGEINRKMGSGRRTGRLASLLLILRSDCFFQFVDQHSYIQRFYQIAVHGGLECLFPVFFKGVGRHG